MLDANPFHELTAIENVVRSHQERLLVLQKAREALKWLDQLGAPYVIGVLNALADVTRSERYRASPYLAERI